MGGDDVGQSPPAPPEVAMELHALNRAKVVRSIRQQLAFLSRPLHGFIFLQGGEEQTRYCTDHLILFRQESYFAYLFGVREPGFYGAIDISNGKSILFAPRLDADYAVWMGPIKPLSSFKERYVVSMVCFTDEISAVLHDQYRGPGKPMLFLLHGLNTDSNNFSKPAKFEEMENFDTDLSLLHPILSECRVFKSELELALIQYANDISSAAHVEVMRRTRVGMKEYQLESIFLHYVYMYGGCRHCSYTCICATGENSAILHYGHAAAPNDRMKLRTNWLEFIAKICCINSGSSNNGCSKNDFLEILNDGDMALFDMGAEYHFYGSDITCSFPVNGKFTADQRLVYDAVLKAHNLVISTMQPGVSWIEMHKLAEETILECLRTGGVLIGDVNEMMEARLGAVFMPHGLGHFLGIDTHDPGGYGKGMDRPMERGLKSLRTVRVLQEGMVITVEPGCYFIDALLLPALEDSNLSKFIKRDELCRFKKFGGVRIESDVHVTANGCQNLTNCPREAWEIEAVMAGAPWPLDKA
ncbi:unnamed protein product [Victoria cruziana]